MVIGSGLLATAFESFYQNDDDICFFASGVSDSTCRDKSEFEREKKLLMKNISKYYNVGSFVYISTCSIEDPCSVDTPYVRHKREMESIVLEHSRSIIFRLPQVVGKTGNPNTLIRFLHLSIETGKKFELWKYANRNIIDIDDVVLIISYYIANVPLRQRILNVANPVNYTMLEIVNSLEVALDKKGVYRLVERGGSYCIDISEIYPIIKESGVFFGKHYLSKIMKKWVKTT